MPIYDHTVSKTANLFTNAYLRKQHSKLKVCYSSTTLSKIITATSNLARFVVQDQLKLFLEPNTMLNFKFMVQYSIFVNVQISHRYIIL